MHCEKNFSISCLPIHCVLQRPNKGQTLDNNIILHYVFQQSKDLEGHNHVLLSKIKFHTVHIIVHEKWICILAGFLLVLIFSFPCPPTCVLILFCLNGCHTSCQIWISVFTILDLHGTSSCSFFTVGGSFAISFL